MALVGCHTQEDTATKEFSPIPLLPWQMAVLGYVCGLFAGTYPGPSCLLLIFMALGFAQGRQRVVMVLCFGTGILVAMISEPTGRSEWDTTARVRGIVQEVRTHPGSTVSIIATDVMNVATNATLPGRLLWSWDDPSYVPEPLQAFEAELRIRPLRGSDNFGLSSREAHWARQNVYHRSFTRGALSVAWGDFQPSWRTRMLNTVSSALTPDQAGAVIRALLFGDRLWLSPEFMDRIRRGGLSHSLALSGLHLALVAGFGYSLAWVVGWAMPGLLLRIPRQKLGILLSLPLVLFYLWMGNHALSLQRAALMLGAAAMHRLMGSRSHAQDSIFVAVAVLSVLDPGSVHDLSLQLSILAVVGIILFVPVVEEWLSSLRSRGPWWRPLHGVLMLGAVTVCANLFILPVLVLYFSEVTGHLWLNVLWLPVLSFGVLPLSFLGLASLPFSVSLANGCFWLAGLGVRILEYGLATLDQAGFLAATAVLRPSGVHVVGYWVVLVVARLFAGGRRFQPRLLAYFGAGLLLLAGPSMAREVSLLISDEVELTVLDTGMSHAVAIRSASGKTLLVDGGGTWNQDYDPGRAIVGPALSWNHPPRVDGVLLSHVDSDHVRGLFYILQAFDVSWFGWSGLLDRSDDSLRLSEFLGRGTVPAIRLRAGDRVEMEPGLWLDVVHPPVMEQGRSENDTSLVLRLVWEGKGLALISGDIEKKAMEEIMRRDVSLEADVLLLPHHGSKSSLLPRFYERVGGRWAVATCSSGNRFNFPHPDVVARCESAGYDVMTTAEHGAIRFRWSRGRGVDLCCSRGSCGGR